MGVNSTDDHAYLHAPAPAGEQVGAGEPRGFAAGERGAIMETNNAITDHERAEEKTRQQEMDPRQVLDLTPLIVAVFGPDRKRLYANRPGLDYFGVTLAEWQSISDPFWFLHPDDRERIAKEIYARPASDIPHEFEVRMRRKDGEYRWFLSRDQPLRDELGRITRRYFSATDIEDRKRAEEALRRSEAYLTEAQRLSHTGSWALDVASDKYAYCSEECLRVYGFDPQEGLPTREAVFGRIHPEDRNRVEGGFAKALREKVDSSDELRVVLPDGTMKHVQVIRHPVLNGAGDVVKLVGTSVDITERKRAEETLRRSEAYLAEAQRLTHMGTWADDGTRQPVYWSEEVFRIWGFDPQRGLPTRDQALQRIHPEDLDRYWQYWQAVLRPVQEIVDAGLEFRIVLPDGVVKHLHAIARPILNAKGEVVEVVGAMVDITERKRAEEAARQSEKQLREVVESIPAMAFINLPDGNNVFVNKRWTEYSGLSAEATAGPGWRGAIYPAELERYLPKWREAIATGRRFEHEVRLRGAKGEYRWFLLRAAPLHDAHGNVLKWYGILTDIEDRKRAEEKLQEENVVLREEISKAGISEEIVGASPALLGALTAVSKVAAMDSTVLITGETGTGKEMIARAIHKKSSRSSRAFVSVNCAAIPQNLIASELFGHEKGAFTGATQRRLGRFELAEGGTIFLDEVGDLPAETQIALLRVLQEREFERVGGTRSLRANVRVIAATNRDLEAAVGAGAFRSDLYYRLNVFPLEIPPLRKRREDIPLLVEYFIARYARKAGKNIRRVDKRSLELLQSYPWPGNVRELQNVIERSVIVCETETLSVDERWLSRRAPASEKASAAGLAEMLAGLEREMIEAALRECVGRVSGPKGAAAKLGMPHTTLESKIRSLKIDKNRFKRDVHETG
jgi:PAS domain S-box-containing protein